MFDFKTFYFKHIRKIWFSIIFIPPVAIIIGCYFYNNIIYNGFLWKYFIGPIVADARNHPINGITEGYNVINTIFYAFILFVALLGIYELFRKKIDVLTKIDNRVVYSLVPFLILGGVLRALEDSGLFSEPYVYFFIAPVIYFTVAFLAACAMSISIYIYKFSQRSYKKGFIFMTLSFFCLNIFYDIEFILLPKALLFFPHPLIFAIFSIIILSIIYIITSKKGIIHYTLAFTGFGLLYLSISVYIILNWTKNLEWTSHYLAITTKNYVYTHWYEIILITGITVGLTLLLLLFFYIVSKKWIKLSAFLTPITTLLIFSQFLDSSATFRGITVYGYNEKHVIPAGLIGIFSTVTIIFILKIVIIITVILFVDVLYKKDLSNYPNANVIIKTLVIILGLSPGIRDMCRIAMGV